MSTLTLTPEEAKPMSGKQVGDSCHALLELKVTKNDETGFEADIVSVEQDHGYEEEDDAMAEEEMTDESYSEDAAATPKAMTKKVGGNPALMIILGDKKTK